MERKDIRDYFLNIIKEDRDVSAGVAAIKTLLKVLDQYNAATVQELDENLQEAVDIMRNTDQPITAVSSGCELFLRFITLAKLDTDSFEECKKTMLKRGYLFLNRLLETRGKVAKQAAQFIVDGCRILTHSKSRVVLQTMLQAAGAHKRFEVFVTRSAPDNSGEEMCQLLTARGVSCTLVLDSSIGYMMEQVDIVMIGAEGVVESGGIINKIGTYTMAMCAKELKKPVYVLTESFKFARLYPLNQRDLPNEFKFLPSTLSTKDISKEHPLVDYTPPSYITLLFTDLGILTPSAVSDELIKLYL